MIAYSLSEAICQEGVPSLALGRAAVASGLMKVYDGEGTEHFEWDKARLDRHSVSFLESLLTRLRVMPTESAQ